MITITKQHWQFEHQLEQAISSLLIEEGINSLNSTNREKRSQEQGVLVKAEHASTDPHATQINDWWTHDIYRMSVSISVMTIRQDARDNPNLSASHWDTVSTVRELMARRLNRINEFLNYHVACKFAPTNSSNGIEDDNIEATILNFETVLKLK